MTYDVDFARERLSVGNNINIIYSCARIVSPDLSIDQHNNGEIGLRTCESGDFLLYSTIRALSDNTFLYIIYRST
jgi:hypothetical protein